MTDGWQLRCFPAEFDPHAPAAGRTADWLRAKAFGFLDPEPDPGRLARAAAAAVADRRQLWGVDDRSATGAGWGPEVPVATCATLRKRINLGGGQSVPAELVADVTVRPGHHGRGHMSRLIEATLEAAADAGVPVAALFAARATLYGRYGFGPATTTAAVEVDCRSFKLRRAPDGTVDMVDPGAAVALVADLLRRHAAITRGAIEPMHHQAAIACGVWSELSGDPDHAVRVAVHRDSDGRVDGFVSYRFRGWTPGPAIIDVRELVALGDNARLALWAHLASSDLADAVHFDHAPPDDPLPWGLEDRRAIRTTALNDSLWLRVLDPVTLLSARGWQGGDGEVVLRVVDGRGPASGTYRLAVVGGCAEVTLAGQAHPDVTLGISALSSIVLGGNRAGALHRVGLIDGDAASVATLDALLAVDPAACCLAHF